MHGYMSDEDLIASGMPKIPRATRYRVPESIKPNTYRKFPRSKTVALSDTIVTRADGTQYVIERDGATRTNRTKNATVAVPELRHRKMAADMAPIGNVE